MKTPDLTDTQKQILSEIAKRLRRKVKELESLIRSGSAQKLARVYVTETQFRWVHDETEQAGAELTPR